MKRVHTAAAFVLGAALTASGALAQPGAGQSPARPPAPGAQMPQPMSNEDAERSMRERRDRIFLENAVQRSHAEIEGSKLALEKSGSQDVKDFAGRMVEEHGQMARKAAELASAKGVTPPDGPSILQKTEITALKALSGGPFDTMYVNRIAVAGHESAIRMFEKAGEETQDPGVKALVGEALPKLREQLELARALNEKQDSR